MWVIMLIQDDSIVLSNRSENYPNYFRTNFGHVSEVHSEFSAMEQSEPPERKRRNREHTNSRNGCTQCKARKVKVRVI